jgi:hypothetical protein
LLPIRFGRRVEETKAVTEWRGAVKMEVNKAHSVAEENNMATRNQSPEHKPSLTGDDASVGEGGLIFSNAAGGEIAGDAETLRQAEAQVRVKPPFAAVAFAENNSQKIKLSAQKPAQGLMGFLKSCSSFRNLVARGNLLAVDGAAAGKRRAPVFGFGAMSPIIAGLLAACGNNRYIAVPAPTPTPPGPQEPPTINLPAINAGEKPENSSIAANVDIYTSQFSGTGVTFALQQNQGDAALFDIDSSTGKVTFKTATTPNYEVKNSYNFTVEATVTDANGAVQGLLRQAVQLDVGNVQETGAIADVTGTAQVGRTLTAGEVTDPDDVAAGNSTGAVTAGVSWQWQVSDTGTGGWTDISGATLGSYVLGQAHRDKYLRVKATYPDAFDDTGTQTVPSAATAAVLPAITFSSSGTGTARPENTEIANTTAIYTAAATDALGGTVTYALKAGVGDVALFNIDSSTGAVTFKTATTPDYELKGSYSFTVTASAGSNSEELVVTIGVTNVQETGTAPVVTGNAEVGQTLTASEITDPDNITATNSTGSVTESWQWQVSDTGTGGWTDIDGATLSSFVIGHAENDKFVRVKATYADEVNSGSEIVVTSAATEKIIRYKETDFNHIIKYFSAAPKDANDAFFNDADTITWFSAEGWYVLNGNDKSIAFIGGDQDALKAWLTNSDNNLAKADKIHLGGSAVPSGLNIGELGASADAFVIGSDLDADITIEDRVGRNKIILGNGLEITGATETTGFAGLVTSLALTLKNGSVVTISLPESYEFALADRQGQFNFVADPNDADVNSSYDAFVAALGTPSATTPYIVNTRPIISDPIADWTVKEGVASSTNVSGKFSDPDDATNDNDGLTFAAYLFTADDAATAEAAALDGGPSAYRTYIGTSGDIQMTSAGVLSLTVNHTLDLNKHYYVRIVATDKDAAGNTLKGNNLAVDDIFKLIIAANTAPTFSSVTATASVAEGMGKSGDTGLKFVATDIEQTLSATNFAVYERNAADTGWVSTASTRFAVANDSGVTDGWKITYTGSPNLDHETEGSIKLRVSVTDGRATTNQDTFVLTVTNVQEAGSTPTISGGAYIASTLTASEVTDPDDVSSANNTGSVTETWQWQVSSTGTDGWSNISGATSKTFVIGSSANSGDTDYSDKYLRVKATYSDTFTGSGTVSVTSAATAQIDATTPAPRFSAVTATASVAEGADKTGDTGMKFVAVDSQQTLSATSFTVYERNAADDGWVGTASTRFDVAADTSVTNGWKITYTGSPDLDHEMEGSIKLRVTASDGSLSTNQDTFVLTVTSVQEAGSVGLGGTIYLGGTVTAGEVTDPDNVTSTNTNGTIAATDVTAWQWQVRDTATGTWSDIATATGTAFEIRDGDAAVGVGKYLRLQATYDDAFTGSGEVTATSTAMQIVDIFEVNSPASGTALVENTQVATGAAVYKATVQGGLSGVTWSLLDNVRDGNLFNINSSTGVVTFKAATTPNYETKSSYQFTVQASAVGVNTPVTKAITIAVTNVQETGVIGAITGTAQIGQTLTAAEVTDGDDVDSTNSTGSVTETWQWQWSDTGTGDWEDITGATSNSYVIGSSVNSTDTGGSVGKYLRVKATYLDSFTANATDTVTVYSAATVAVTGGPLINPGDYTAYTGTSAVNTLNANDSTPAPTVAKPDLDTGTTAYLIQGGDENDIIEASNGGDIIIGGQGADTITLGSGTDMLVHRVEADPNTTGASRMKDGGDTVNDYARGTDKFALLDESNTATSLATFKDWADGADNTFNTNDDAFAYYLIFDGSYNITGVKVESTSSGFKTGNSGPSAGGTLTINFTDATKVAAAKGGNATQGLLDFFGASSVNDLTTNYVLTGNNNKVIVLDVFEELLGGDTSPTDNLLFTSTTGLGVDIV